MTPDSIVAPTSVPGAAPDVSSAGLSRETLDRVAGLSLLLIGLGNIGSFLAWLLARLLDHALNAAQDCSPNRARPRLILVDRDRVEVRNAWNQNWAPGAAGLPKAGVLERELAAVFPRLEIVGLTLDAADLPAGFVAQSDAVLLGLDSLGARQIACDLARPLGVPVIDGAVGPEFQAQVRLFAPGGACLECAWGERQYRAVTAEYPCGGRVSEPVPTPSPAALGAIVAGAMVAELTLYFSGEGRGDVVATGSRELDLCFAARRFRASSLRRAVRCRCDHTLVRERLHLDRPLDESTFADLARLVRRTCGEQAQLTARRGLFPSGPFGARRQATLGELDRWAEATLADAGFTRHDLLFVRHQDRLAVVACGAASSLESLA